LLANEVTGDEIATAAIIGIATIVTGYVARRLVRKALLRKVVASDLPVDEGAANLAARLTQIAVIVVGTIYALLALDVQIGPLLGTIGLGGLAIAFVLKDVLENFVAGLILQLRRPFTIGSEIVIDNWNGIVSDVGFRYVTIRQFDGTEVLIPARYVLQGVIVNNTAGSARRTTLEVMVAYGTDLAAARTVLVQATANSAGVLPEPAPEALAMSFLPSGVRFDLRYWHDPRRNLALAVHDHVVANVWSALSEAGMQIPFPQRVVHLSEDSESSFASNR
jgi:small-conductance mechanosensitive channel